MGIIAAGQITVVDLSDAPVLNAFITASRPTTQTYSKDSRNYNPSYASTPQVLTLNVTKSGSTTSIIDSIRGLHWFVVDGSVKTEITTKVNTSNEYISGAYDENLTTKINIDTTKGYRRYEATGVWRDPSTDLDVQFSATINLLLTQNGATGPQGPQGDKGETGNGIANTVVTYGLSMSDTTEPATWSSDRPAFVKGMYLWVRTVIIYTNGESTTSYQISYIPKDGDATGEIDKTKQELLEKLESVRDDSLAAVEEAKEQLETVRNDSLAAAEEAKQQVATVANDLSKAKTDFQNAVNTVDTKATNVQNDLSKAKQDLTSHAQQLQTQANAQSELTNRISSVEETANGTKTTVSELSKSVDQNGKNITSVTARTKVVEDDLAGTKTTLSQVKMTADSTSQKTATLETGLNGLSAKFDSLKIGGANLLLYSADPWQAPQTGYYQYFNTAKTGETYNGAVIYKTWNAWGRLGINLGIHLVGRGLLKVGDVLTYSVLAKTDQETPIQSRLFVRYNNQSGTENINGKAETINLTNEWQKVSVTFTVTKKMLSEDHRVSYLGWEQTTNSESGKFVYYTCNKIERGNIATDYSSNDADLEQKIAEYKQNADQNYARLQTTVQNLDGTVQHNKSEFDQTAQGFTTRIESLETYKSGESTRANQYFELAKTETARQLSVERTAIAKDYVAKSTYTSDVTGIRNELSATTTTASTVKTNLANYQASNDRAVANLQSSMQTANGNISSLKTKVEAVPGQITSAVSAVEGKIPTNVSTRNLILKSNDFANPHKQNGPNTTVTSTDDYFVIRSTGYTANAWGGMSWNMSISEMKAGEQFSILMPVYIDSSISLDGGFCFELKRHNPNTRAYNYNIPTDKKDQWFNVAITFKVSNSVVFDTYPFFVFLVKNGLVRIKPPMLVRGNLIPSDYQPAFEDTKSDISAVSSELKQTADGITLLATKTELNTAKNELQSGINTATNKANNAQATANSNAQTISTHTTQISALNTGLSAKVSQTDFNTLSGRVTNAENNITAKANELSSKITSVEGKLPTSVDTVNLVKGTGSPFIMGYGITNTTWNETKKQSILDFSVPGVRRDISGEILPQENKFFNFKPIKGTTYTQSIMIDTDATFNPNGEAYYSWFANGSHNRQKAYIKKVGERSYQVWSTYTWNLENTPLRAFDLINLHTILLFRTTGTYLAFYKPKLTAGNLPSDWSPSPEDYDDALTRVSSEIKQTADGITLLAKKTELNTAKNELQSGINTATNKANNAQTTANNNAQTISTHTTQISALNTGLNAKVSQSDFNTLSGRVTTAENNITAKANELSSKITSVEGKIPTEIGSSNLLRKTAVNTDNLTLFGKTDTTVSVVKKDGHQVYKLVFSGSSNTGAYFTGNDYYYNLVKDRDYTFSFWVLTNKDKNYNMNSLGHIQAVNTNGDKVGNDALHQHTSPVYSTSVVKANTWTKVWCTFKATSNSYFKPYFWYLKAGDEIYIYDMMLNEGKVPLSYTPAPEDTAAQISSLSSEFKQTTDSIKASVTSLDKSTVKNSSLTINADGIVMKAGKSTTDVANAIGSYFAVNQNAINLFSDKIKVKGNMIVNGTITGDKIKASSVDVSKIVGIDANFIKSKIEYAMIDWLKGKTITAYNGNMTIDLQNGRISFKDGSNAVYRQTSDGIHTGFLHFEAGSLGGIYAAFGATSTRQGINSKSSEFAGIRCYRVSANGDSHDAKIDKIEVVGDTVQFGHGYRSDGSIGGGFIMDTAAFANETPYSFNRVIKSIEALWRILHDHAKNTGYRFNDSAFINALNNEYNAWHDMHNQ